MSGETLERARNRWREILPQLGIDTRFLTNKHGPCPLCGGKDRFRFTDRTGNGDYYCHQCHAGVGLTLVRKKNQWDFKTAASEIDKILGRAPQQSPTPRPDPKADATRRLKRIKQALAEATDDRIVESFLCHRQIEVSSLTLRGHRALPYFEDGKIVGRFPAVLAPVIAPEEGTVTATALYCAGAPEPRKKFLPVTSTINGAAVRLWEPEENRLGVAEGIATAMAARQLFGVPTWAALSANGLKTFKPPPDVNSVVIFADCDASFTGQAAAFDLAQRLVRDGLTVDVKQPSEFGTDFAEPSEARRAVMKQPKLPPFAPLPKAVINSPAFKSLQHVDVRILVVLLSKFNGYNNGAIAFGVREAAHECRCSQATACRGLDRLQKAGLIECTYKGHTVPEPGRPDAPSRWRITFLENVQPKERKFHAAS